MNKKVDVVLEQTYEKYIIDTGNHNRDVPDPRMIPFATFFVGDINFATFFVVA
jgi:hypothetical protein